MTVPRFSYEIIKREVRDRILALAPLVIENSNQKGRPLSAGKLFHTIGDDEISLGPVFLTHNDGRAQES